MVRIRMCLDCRVKCYEKDPLYLAGWSVLKKHHPDLEYHNIPNDLNALIHQCTIMNAQLRPPFKTIVRFLLFFKSRRKRC